MVYVAALGLVDAVFVMLSALAYGIIDVHSAQISKSEGAAKFVQEYPTLLLSALVAIIVSWVPVKISSLFFVDILTLLKQPVEAIVIAESNLQVRADAYVLGVMYVIVPLALRVRGYRRLPLVLIGLSLLLKLYLNSVIEQLFAQLARSHIEQAVAYVTAIVQAFSISIGLLVLLSSTNELRKFRFDLNVFAASCRDLISHAPKIAVWNLNDFASSAVVVFVFGRIGTDFLAAANLASKLTSLFYRVPQALTESAFIFYSYALNRTLGERRRINKSTVIYSVLPVVILGFVVLFCANDVVRYMTPGAKPELQMVAGFIIKVHMLFALFYVLQHLFSQFLVVERQTRFLLISSVMSTWLLVIPGVFLLDALGLSGEAIIVFERCSIALMALVNIAYFKYFQSTIAPSAR